MPYKHKFLSKELLIPFISIPSQPLLQEMTPGMKYTQQAMPDQGTFFIPIN